MTRKKKFSSEDLAEGLGEVIESEVEENQPEDSPEVEQEQAKEKPLTQRSNSKHVEIRIPTYLDLLEVPTCTLCKQPYTISKQKIPICPNKHKNCPLLRL